jgi:hypothetical protein
MKKIFFLSFLMTIMMAFGSGISYSQTGNNAILEYCTGAWCQWCPCGDLIAQGIQNVRPNTLILAYHGPPNTGSDPMSFFNGNSIINLLGLNAYPTGIVGRESGIISRNQWGGWVNLTSNEQPGVSYSITKSYNTSTRQLDVSVTATALRNIDTACYINFVVYEDGIVYPQTGNSSCPGSSTWIHDWVVRNMVNGPTGELLHASGWTQGTTATKSWTTTLSSAWVANDCIAAVFAYLGNGSSINTAGSPVQQTLKQSVTEPVGVSSNTYVPSEYSLSQNYPNPFNPTTNIKFSLPKDGQASLKIYDIIGNEVATYLEGFVKAGSYNAEIDGSNWASGVYFYRLTTPEFTDTKKMTVVK